MQRRFGLADFIVCFLLLLILVSIWLAMKQYDRQWELMRRAQEQVTQLTNEQARMSADLTKLADKLVQGSISIPANTAAQNSGTNTTPNDKDPFARMRAAQAKPNYAAGDWLVDVFSAKVARLTPLISGDAYAAEIQGRVLETLATRDPETLEWSPLLSQSWKISEDGLTITFQMRPGVTFSDGVPLTAHDVQFTFDLIMNPDVDCPRDRNGMQDVLQSVKATSDREVVFTFKEPYFEAFALAAGLQVMPKHFYGPIKPEELNKDPGLLLGSGSYRLASPRGWAPGDPIRLERNDRYWGVKPAFEKLAWQEINNDVARLTAFKNGDIDLFGAMPEQHMQLKEDPKIKERAQYFEYESPTSGYGFIAWNQRRDAKETPFADKRVRQAMAMLWDRDRFNREIMYGYAVFPTGPFNRLSKQYNSDAPAWSFDPEKARALLKEAGYMDRDNDGVIESADGKPFRFKATYPAGGDFWTRVFNIWKDSCARVGIILEQDPLEWAVFGERVKSRAFDSLSMAWTAGIESDIHQMFHSSNITDGDNFTNYKNPEVDKLIDQARHTVDESKRMPMWKEIHRLLVEDQPYCFLYSRRATMYTDKRFANVQLIKLGLNDSLEWYVPKALQRWTKQ